MQIVNTTDEPIVLEPGEAIEARTVRRAVNGDVFRVCIDSVSAGPMPRGDLELDADKIHTRRFRRRMERDARRRYDRLERELERNGGEAADG